MAKARDIIRGALSFHLNRLSPGEAEDADLFNRCLEALNAIADEVSGAHSVLFREILTAGTVNGASGTLGTTWVGLVAGDEILGATVSYSAGMDVPVDQITMAQYADIPIKSTVSIPRMFAHDGQSTVYFYPAAAGQTVTLRTRQVVSDFADLDTEYTMPKGYKSALMAMLAEKMAPSIAPALAGDAKAAGASARLRLAAQASNPATLNSAAITSHGVGGNVLTGWR